MRIAPELLDRIVGHALADAPAECCGVVVTRDGVAQQVRAFENLAASPMRFEVDGLALHHLLTEVEEAGLELGAIYHSHTRSAPEPSQTDVNFAANWPGVEWVIVGTGGAEPEVRSFLIEDGLVREVPLSAP